MAASTSVGDLCRLCGTDTLNIVRNAIFEGEGRVKKYALKISECLTLQVTQEDRLPKIMCGECTYKLDLISDFRDKAFKTETLLISKLDLDVVKPEIPDEDDGPDLNNDDVGGDDFHSSSPEPPIEPEVVVKEEDHAVEKRPGRKAATKRSMRESESEEEEEEAPAKKRGRKPKETPTATATAPVAAPPKENTGAVWGAAVEDSACKCLMCPKMFISVAEMQTHLRFCINSGQTLKLMVQRLTDDQLLVCQTSLPTDKNQVEECHECQLCGEKLKSAEFLKCHERSHSTTTLGEMKCAIGECNLTFTSIVLLKEHRQEHYQAARITSGVPGKRPLGVPEHIKSAIICTCQMCGKSFKARSLKMHLIRHNADTPGFVKCLYGRCNKLFQSGDELRKHTEDAHQDVKLFKCDICSKYFKSKKVIRNHVTWHLHQRLFKCNLSGCSYAGKYKGELRFHIENTHSLQSLTCSYCSKQYKSKDSYRSHLMTHTKSLFKCFYPGCKKLFYNALQLKNHKDQSHQTIEGFPCQVCGQYNSSKQLLITHMLQHQIGKIACPVPGCTFVSNSYAQMTYHRNKVHVLQFDKTCHLCGQGCHAAVQFQQHMDAHTSAGQRGHVKCVQKDCQESFPDALDLRTHMKMHGYVHKCDLADCLFVSSSESDLKLHKVSVHSIWPHTCQLCGRGFNRSSSLSRHVKNHETSEPGVIKCSYLHCKRTFTAISGDLMKHMKSHAQKGLVIEDSAFSTLETLQDPNSKANECKLCGRSLKTKNKTIRQKHVLKHVTDTPGVIKCSMKYCKQTFTSAADLKKHRSKHKGLKEQVFGDDTPECSKALKSSLQTHKQIVHNSQVWSCHLCDKMFKYKKNLQRHVRSMHAGRPSPTDQDVNVAEQQQAVDVTIKNEEATFD